VATSLNNIGLVYSAQGNFSEALKHYFASLKMREALASKTGIASCCINIGELFMKQKQYEEAKRYFLKAKKMSVGAGSKEAIKLIYRDLATIDSTAGNYKGAFEYRKMYVLYRDSLDNEEARKKIIQSQMTYEFEKKEAIAAAEHKKELENQELITEEQSRKQKLVLFFVLGFLLLVVIFAAFILRSLRVTRRQKNIIEEQKNLVEKRKQELEWQKGLLDEHQREIIDSINYAKRIQQSQLPTETYIDRSLKRLRRA
jgi:tetratricopeptide (TPR) repeat protein